MKKLFAGLLALVAVLSLAACGGSSEKAEDATQATTEIATEAAAEPSTQATEVAETVPPAPEGKVFNIYTWNGEFKDLLEAYYCVPAGVQVNWIIPSAEGGVYQDQLEAALLAQSDTPDDEKIDLFLVDGDSIGRFVNSDFTMDVSTIGVTPTDTMYPYTVQAATDDSGIMKGVAYQCCPTVLLYRRSIARDVLGTNNSATVQEALSDWEKFDEAAAAAKEKGYYMTPSYAETFSAFAASRSLAWTDENNNLQFDPMITAYLDQAKYYLENGYTLACGIRSEEKTQQMLPDGKTMCFFAPAWYYNACLAGAAQSSGTPSSDWGICPGPQPFFWGGSWLLAATGTDNPSMVADIMNTFTFNEDVCAALVENNMLFSNNATVNQRYAEDPSHGNPFLAGQNDTAVFAELADTIPYGSYSQYDQLLNEQLPAVFLDYFLGNITEEEAYANFYACIREKYPAIVTPTSD